MAQPVASFLCPITLELMKEPMIDPDGNTYERSAIEDWLKKNSTSPITRRPLSIKDLRVNRALRSSIDEYRSHLSQDVTMKNNPVDIVTTSNETSSKLTITSSWANGLTHISIQPPPGIGVRAPCDICCVVDTSGSMDDAVEIQGSNNDKAKFDFSQLDIVKHALRTIIHSLTHLDRLSIISFADNATILFKLLQMDNKGKTKALAALERLKSDGSTNLWDGLRVGLEILAEQQRPMGSNAALFLLTDGCPNVEPPRGCLRTLAAYKKKTNFSCFVNTFGFGYALNSKLLEELAEMGNMGSYAFIPDGSFVGTIFVNAIANLLAAVATNVQLIVSGPTRIDSSSELLRRYSTIQAYRLGASEVRFNLGSITFGQSKDILLPTTIEHHNMLQIELVYESAHGQKINRSKLDQNIDADVALINRHSYRLQFIDCIRAAMDLNGQPNKKRKGSGGKTTPSESLKLLEKSMQNSSNDPYILDLLKDLTDQVRQAFSRDGWFTKWGIHYLLSLTRAHLLQQCNNFKDPGVQHYGQGALFNSIRDEMDSIFCGLPPPKPSIQIKPVSNSPKAKRPKSASRTPAQIPAPAPINMSFFNSANNPCFHGFCKVRLIDDSFKLVKDVRRGDRLFPHGGTVNYVLRTICSNNQAQMVVFNTGLIITPWHPVRLDGIEWVFPYSLIPTPTEIPCEAVYSFALDEGHTMWVNDIECVTLGHGFDADVVRHTYYGSDQVIEDLRIMDRQQNCTGLIEMQSNWITRDKQTGLVNSIRQPSNTYIHNVHWNRETEK